ncbi:hypothetical protein B1218_35890, partial [Pseudomonas ogarae]
MGGGVGGEWQARGRGGDAGCAGVGGDGERGGERVEEGGGLGRDGRGELARLAGRVGGRCRGSEALLVLVSLVGVW